MKRILVLGSGGQIGSELTMRLREVYGDGNVVATDINPERLTKEIQQTGPTAACDATKAEEIAAIVDKYKIDSIYNLVAILSATAEKNPMLGWNVGMGALLNCRSVPCSRLPQ